MKTTFTKKLENQNCIVTIATTELAIGNYAEAVKDFGEESINIGGAITDGKDVSPTTLFTLPDISIKLSALVDKPITQTFIYSQYKEKTQPNCEAWIAEITKRIDAYITVLSAKVDSFTGVTEKQLAI